MLLNALLLIGLTFCTTLPSFAQTQPVPHIERSAKNGQIPVDTTDGMSYITLLYELPNYLERLKEPGAAKKARPSSTGIFSFLDQTIMGSTLDELFELSLKHIKRPGFENPDDFEMIEAVLVQDPYRIDEGIIKFWFIEKKLLGPQRYSRN